MRIYKYEKHLIPFKNLVSNPEIKKDYLPHLKLFKEKNSNLENNYFFTQALARLQRGEHIYTYVENNTLVHYGWEIEKQNVSYVEELGINYTFPTNDTVLYDFYTVPEYRGRHLYQQNLATILKTIYKNTCVQTVYIMCLANNKPSRKVIEKLGFSYITSLYKHKWCFGTVKKYLKFDFK